MGRSNASAALAIWPCFEGAGQGVSEQGSGRPGPDPDPAGFVDEEIASALAVGTATVGRTRRRFAEGNLGALEEHPRSGGPPETLRQQVMSLA